ncbi:MAG TPA: NAD(P)H-dependent glycerol-3-phosphate dehydrogenase [Gemmatimonadaceae bacterium]|nr:NAD(P)H-dependent glycerol-3-phosphate dehydrogenase [Gemmatimonadaceae bacterium]
MSSAVVVGAGAWGTALADLVARNGHDTTLWARESDVVADINTQCANSRFLKGVSLSPSLRATDDLSSAVADATTITFVAPSHVLRSVIRSAAHAVPDDAILIVATKGIERETFALMTDIVAEELPGRPVVALSGPSFALEVAMRQPTAVVAASREQGAALHTQQLFSSPEFRVYTQRDVVGVELGGALKNVMAVATGVLDGLGLGFNPRAALITRGLAEMTRLGVALGAEPQTFAGLAGMGDLVLTCTGSLSRNRTVGVEIGQGRPIEEVLHARETVAEGVVTTQSAHALAVDRGVEMPIVSAMHRILFEAMPPRDAIAELMARALRAESD